jgi:enoyl-[acyl-carrier-protein] reductase (NADH)
MGDRPLPRAHLNNPVIQGKTCITHAGYNAAVTGAGSGNGKAITETLLAEGARVALLDIDPESLKDTTSRYAGAFAVPVDVADADSVHDAIGAIEQEFGHLDGQLSLLKRSVAGCGWEVRCDNNTELANS